MEPITLSSPSRVCVLLHLPSTQKAKLGASHCPHPRPRSLPFSISCGAPPGGGDRPAPEPKDRASRLRFPPALSSALLLVLQSAGDFVLCRSRIARLCLRGGLDGGEGILCSGGIGTLLLSTTAAAVSRARASPFLAALAANPTFVSGMVAWALAQATKVVLNFFVERRWELGVLFNSGGMPSSHAALCTALTASVALCHGVGDALFPVCLGFSLIVMYDATGVRRHAGMQAAVLNMIVEDLFQGHPISQRKLKELLGHTPSQVFAGAFLGILVACVCCQGSVVAI